jgi:hypothetical protein
MFKSKRHTFELSWGIPSGVRLSVNPSGTQKNGHFFQDNPSEERPEPVSHPSTGTWDFDLGLGLLRTFTTDLSDKTSVSLSLALTPK